MSYVLDTNVIAALMRGEATVIARLERVTRQMVAVPEPVWAEVAHGLARMPRSKRRERLMARFEFLREELPSVEWSPEVSDAFGALKAALEARGQRLEDFDLAIAAHALATDAVLVSANLRHLGGIDDLEIEDWG